MVLDATQVSAEVDGVRATYRRSGTDAVLEIEASLPGVEAAFETLPNSIQACCEAEVARSTCRLRRLTSALMTQVHDAGDQTRCDDRLEWNEERRWRAEGTSFAVAGTDHRNTTRMTLKKDASDAGLLRGAMENVITGRELAIRDVYAHILQDAARPQVRPAPDK